MMLLIIPNFLDPYIWKLFQNTRCIFLYFDYFPSYSFGVALDALSRLI